MYVNHVDEMIDGLLNKFNEYLTKEKAFKLLSEDTNFVKFQNNILSYIKNFLDTIAKKDIISVIKNESYYESIMNIIKRYCAFYIYLGIGYYYEGGRDLYITNIIESSKYIKEATIQITNFFNSENNSKIITFYNDIKNFLGLLQYKTIDKIKIILGNNPLRYESTINLFNDLGEDYIVEYFLIKENFHNIMKALIFKQIYMKEEKNEIITMMNQQEKDKAEYKYIEIIVSNQQKLVDFNVIQKFLSMEEMKTSLAEEIYSYLEEVRDIKEIIIKENQYFINYLFSNQILIPISEDFLRYHKDTEKYDPESLVEAGNIKERDATKIKYIINKMNNVKNYYSTMLEKNPKLKLDIEALFYKQLDPRKAVLYNNDEEVKIIQKLKNSENAADIDLLVDLENIRKYSYVNFKNLSKDGIKLRTTNTIQGIRSTNIHKGMNKNDIIESRICNDSVDMNVVGVAWNPSYQTFDKINIEDMIDVRKTMKDENGFNAFTKTMAKTFGTKDKKLHYWMFDITKDKPKLDTYIDYGTDAQHNIKVMLEQIYNNYIELVRNKLEMYIKKTKEMSIWKLYNVLSIYKSKYFDMNLVPNMKNDIIETVLIDMIPELEIVPDDVDSMIPGKRGDLIKLPVIDISKYKKNILVLGETEIDVSLELSKQNIPICQHYIRWKNILKISKKSDDFNQAIVDFVKQYVTENKMGDYICKSCSEMVQIQKYVSEISYNEETNTFSTTSIVVNQRLEEIPKYAKYTRAIRNIEKTIEKIAYSMDLLPYLGNTPTIKLRRKMIIKDVIDTILIHSEWIKKQGKDRSEQMSRKYGINKDLTTLFFFELKDEIFLTSSTETDYYKLIKYNNIIAYIILMMITEMNSGQILGLREDKRFNYFFFKKIGDSLFNDLFIRVSQKEKTPLNKLPLFAYILYYTSGILAGNRIWLHNDTNIDVKQKITYQINLQKIIIHTVVDLINTLVEANFEENKNFLYEILNTRISVKLKNTFNDLQLFKRVEVNSMKNINFDDTTRKVTFLTKKIPLVEIDGEFNIIEKLTDKCDLAVSEIEKLPIKHAMNIVDNMTNCPDGKFHVWIYKSGDMICKLCSQNYNDIVKTNETTSEKTSYEFLDKLKIEHLKKLSKKYCITGEMHEIDTNGICTKCKFNINKIDESQLDNKDLKILGKNLELKENQYALNNINKMKEYKKTKEADKEKYKKIINKFLKRYVRESENNIEKYISHFIDKLIKILGPKIKVNNKTIYLKETVYIVDHDYIGNTIREPFTILSTDDKIQLAENHPSFNKDVLYYKDKANKVYVYYDSITMQHLGYSEDNKNIRKSKNNVSLQVELSIKDSIMYLGYENQYINIYHLNKKYLDKIPTNLGDDTKDTILSIIRNRMANLKQIIERSQSIIYNIRNGGNITSVYNIDEKEIINEFTKKLKKFNVKDKDEHNNIFKHQKYITHKLPINYNIPDNINIELNKNYMNINFINNMNNADSKLLFYYIYNFDRLLSYNTMPVIQSELCYLIIKIIKFSFNSYYRPYSNYMIRKFDYMLINEIPYKDENIKMVGHYMELLSREEIDDPNRKDEKYDEKEARDSLDIDDYEQDDDIDGSMEALDGYE